MEILAVFPPLIAFLLAFLLGKQMGDKGAQIITCSGVIIAAIASCVLFIEVIFGNDMQGDPRTITLMTWIASGDFVIDWALRVDQLTVVMMCVVNIVSACVHVYSIGYMAEDPAKARFMSYLSLFTFAMLMLVSADNLLQLFFGWEGVGVASYLLIGFWNHKESANAAAIKAFVVNRVGDFGLALGVMAAFFIFGTVQFDAMFEQAAGQAAASFTFFGHDVHALTVMCLLLFMGAMGKSAQLGLHTWLPDAMEGPTPVSALIHAATMVTAGVFLVARMSPVFEYAPDALMVVTVVGAATAFVAATIGMTQFDIKRVIAYSTMSQLGYMFFALGVSAYSAAIFHLMTHAFFKALLFLGAGSVIHALHHEQDMRRMGGVWRVIPATYALMWIGSLALAGVPFFAGFYSKDVILEAAWADHTWFGEFAFWAGISAAVMTAFYSGRLLFMTFHGKPRMDDHTFHHAHESPPVMLTPLVILAIGAIGAGALFYGGFVGSSKPHYGHHEIADGEHQDQAKEKHSEISDKALNKWSKEYFWGDSLLALPQNDTVEAAHSVPKWVKILPILAGGLGLFLAWVFYMKVPVLPERFVMALRPLHNLLFRKWYFDEIYHWTLVTLALASGKGFSASDKHVIDGLGPDGSALASRGFAGILSKLQSGYLFHYAFVMMLGVIGLLSWFFVSAVLRGQG